MTPTTVTTKEQEAALQAFLGPIPEDARVPVRTLAHAWAAAGGVLAPGQHAVRLLGPGQGDLPPFTAATLYPPRADAAPARLELARPLLERHGVGHDAFLRWCDEVVDLGGDGFDPSAKYPALPLPPHLETADLARLVGSLRDLARMAGA